MAARAKAQAGPGEALLAQSWAERLYRPDRLLDEAGQRVRVIFPGRRWGGPGPDFQGAVLSLEDGSLVRGDVEVHARASGWLRHGHSSDPRYRGVVLHVVGVADIEVLGPDGPPLRTVVLPAPRLVSLPLRPPPCHRHAGTGDLVERLRDAGLHRFRDRASRFEGDCEALGPEQALWRGLLESMGYSENRTPFAMLAALVPWSEVSRLARGGPQQVQEALVAASGLAEVRARAHVEARAWSLAAVRPANHPLTRIQGLAMLAHRWAGARDRLLEVAERTVRVAAATRRPSLCDWALTTPWIGSGWATVAAINVLLPWASARGVAEAEDAYLRAAAEPASRPARYMATLLGASLRDVNTACLRQGLLQVYKESCEARWCEGCALASTTPAAR